ncbi:MAG: TolC family protein [Pseudohongiellaceae bacterium]
MYSSICKFPLCASVALSLFSSVCLAQDTRLVSEQVTNLADVLRSAAEFYPSIQAAQAAIAEQEAEFLAANGAFDPRVDGSAYSRLSGFYNGTASSAGVYQAMPFMGAELFADYSVSGGTFPVYEDQLVTTDTGQARIGFALSLLRDRDIDDARFAVKKAELETEIAEFDLFAQQIQVLQQAYITYAGWLISAHLLEAYEELLEVAEVRGEALERQSAAGDVAEILVIENDQAILQREGLVVEARRQVQLSAERLALFLRSEDGLPVYPRYDISLSMPDGDEDFLDQPVALLIDQALENRPDIAVAKTLQQQFRLERKIAENMLKPQLDFRLYTARDFGDGSITRMGTDTIADISFSIPLETRAARGKIASADARLLGVGYELRLIIDQAERDLRLSLVNLKATSELQDVAVQELQVAQVLADAEARQFEAGTSDYFLLNVRERMLGEAQLRRWQAELNHQIALANYYGISMNMPILLGENSPQ